jgi:hypothetical protein
VECKGAVIQWEWTPGPSLVRCVSTLPDIHHDNIFFLSSRFRPLLLTGPFKFVRTPFIHQYLRKLQDTVRFTRCCWPDSDWSAAIHKIINPGEPLVKLDSGLIIGLGKLTVPHSDWCVRKENHSDFGSGLKSKSKPSIDVSLNLISGWLLLVEPGACKYDILSCFSTFRYIYHENCVFSLYSRPKVQRM